MADYLHKSDLNTYLEQGVTTSWGTNNNVVLQDLMDKSLNKEGASTQNVTANVTFSGTSTIASPITNGEVTGTAVSNSGGNNKLIKTTSTGNAIASNFMNKYTTTATAAGTTTLTVSSNRIQRFTGTTTQTVKMPVASTLTLGQTWEIINDSTGKVTVNSSGSNTIETLGTRERLSITCILLSGTDENSWTVTKDADNTSDTLALSQQVSIQSDPTGAVEGGVTSFLASGLTLVNSVVNGNFASGTTGWTISSLGSPTVANNILSFTATAESGQIYQRTMDSTLGDKIFAYCNVKYTGTGVRFLTENVGAVAPVNPIIGDGTTKEVYVTGNIFASGVRVLTGVRDTRTTGWTQVDISNFVVINMTALGLDASGLNYTEAQMLDLVRGGYFEGMANTKNLAVKSVGKNLFDKTTVRYGAYNLSTGIFAVDTTIYATQLIRIKNTQDYKLSGNAAAVYRYFFFDSNKAMISTSTSTTGYQTTPANAYYIAYQGAYANFPIADIQLEEGSTATTYESYRQSQYETECELRSLPDGTRDTLDGNENHIQRIEEYTLQSGDITNLITGTNLQRVVILMSVFSGIKTQPTGIGNETIISGLIKETVESNFDTAGYDNYWTTGPTNLLILKPLLTYADLAAAKAGLTGTKIQYQLATPVTTNLITDGKARGIVKSFADGTIYQDCAYNQTITSSGTPDITLTEVLREITQLTYIDTTTNEILEVPVSGLTLSTDGLTITGSTIPSTTECQVKGYLFYNISAGLTGEIPVNQSAVITSLNSTVGQLSDQTTSNTDAINLIIAGL